MFISSSAENIVVAEAWDRPDAAVRDRFAELSASIVGDVLDRMTALDGGIRLWTEQPKLVGFALPVDVPAGDNLGIHRALDEAQPGDVLIVNGRADVTRALVGDLIGEIMSSRGMAGAVIDGAIRDVDELSRQGHAIYARAVTPAGPFKNGPGSVGRPIAVGGVVISAGDLLVADRDGVVVVPRDNFDVVLARVDAAMGNEHALRERIVAAGEAMVSTVNGRAHAADTRP
jgi:regulator of RNase E activity RraA